VACLLEARSECARYANLARRRQIAVGEEHHDARSAGQWRGVPPTVALRLDQRRGIGVGSGRRRSQQRGAGDEPIGLRPPGALPSRERAAPSGAVDHDVRINGAGTGVGRDSYQPSAAFANALAKRSANERGARFACCFKETRVERVAIEMPPGTERVQHEIGDLDSIAAPRRAVGQRLAMALRCDSCFEAERREDRTRGRRQSFADRERRALGRIQQGHPNPGARERECGHGTGRPATDDENATHVVSPTSVRASSPAVW